MARPRGGDWLQDEMAALAAAGVGVLVRASLLVAGVLTLEGMAAGDAWGLIERARGLAVPDTAEQRAWPEGALRAVLRSRTGRPAG